VAPSISAIFKIGLIAGEDMLERFRLEAELACKRLRNGPFTKIYTAFFFFLNGSQDLLCVLVLVILDVCACP